MTEKHRQELDHEDRERVCRLLTETGSSPGSTGAATFLIAYNVILLKDIRFALNELLSYRQSETHR